MDETSNDTTFCTVISTQLAVPGLQVQCRARCFSLSLLTTASKAYQLRFSCHYTAFVKDSSTEEL